MKLAVIGSRDWSDYPLLHRQLLRVIYGLPTLTIVVNKARPDAHLCPHRGADEMAHWFAYCRALPVIVCGNGSVGSGDTRLADDPFQVIRDTDLHIAFWNGASPGTCRLIMRLKAAGKRVGVMTPDARFRWEEPISQAQAAAIRAVTAHLSG